MCIRDSVQTIFDGSESQYRWVISMSRAVEITNGPYTDQGVLLIDIRYNSLERLFDGVNLGNGGYAYLISSDGEIIYHPKAQLIDSGIVKEKDVYKRQGLNRSFYRVCVKTREENRRLMEYMGKAVKEENGAKRNGPE